MNLRDELQELTKHAVTDNPEIVAAYEHIVRYMKVRAKNGEHSCALSHTSRLSTEQLVTHLTTDLQICTMVQSMII